MRCQTPLDNKSVPVTVIWIKFPALKVRIVYSEIRAASWPEPGVHCQPIALAAISQPIKHSRNHRSPNLPMGHQMFG